jgi:hypothetical protein
MQDAAQMQVHGLLKGLIESAKNGLWGPAAACCELGSLPALSQASAFYLRVTCQRSSHSKPRLSALLLSRLALCRGGLMRAGDLQILRYPPPLTLSGVKGALGCFYWRR